MKIFLKLIPLIYIFAIIAGMVLSVIFYLNGDIHRAIFWIGWAIFFSKS